MRHILGEWGWISANYEVRRSDYLSEPDTPFQIDRQKLIYDLIKLSGEEYTKNNLTPFPGYHQKNTMKFARNYALTQGRLLPDFYQILSSAKGCVDHNFAYEVWELGTEYPFYKNIDNLHVEPFTPEQIWGHSKLIQFHLRSPSRKAFLDFQKLKDKSKRVLYPPGPFTNCS